MVIKKRIKIMVRQFSSNLNVIYKNHDIMAFLKGDTSYKLERQLYIEKKSHNIDPDLNPSKAPSFVFVPDSPKQ